MNKWLVFAAIAIIMLCMVMLAFRDFGKKDVVEVVKTDTLYITKTDTVPKLVTQQVTRYVRIPVVHTDTVIQTDSIEVPVVQKKFSDDSTYTAYVSGVQYGELPALDSISIRQKQIEKIIERTITKTKQQRFGFGVTSGFGIGVTSGKPDIYIGAGGFIRIF